MKKVNVRHSVYTERLVNRN